MLPEFDPVFPRSFKYFLYTVSVVSVILFPDQLTEVNLQKIDKFMQERTPSFFMQPEETMLDGIEADVSMMIKLLEKPFAFT